MATTKKRTRDSIADTSSMDSSNYSYIEGENKTDSKSIFTTKNIVIGVLAIGTVLGLLKWQKVI
jgi:hypothetical protein